MKLRPAALLLLALGPSGCSRYAEFRLPPAPGPPGEVSWRWAPRPGPVLGRGTPGSWDAVDVLNPTVVRRRDMFYNFYSGYDGKTWHTGLATSADGVEWSKRGKVLSPDPAGWEGGDIGANGSALAEGDGFLYWYQAGDPPRIGLARAADGITWKKHPDPVLDTGPRGSWDERGVADPYVIRIEGWYYLYYLGQDRARRQRIGLARSRDGVGWEKHRANPILELGPPGSFDETGLGEPAVWAFAGRYWMLYTARDPMERRRLGLTSSTDGVGWKRYSELPLAAGTEPWNSMVLCDPAVEPSAGGVHVWFGGGDRPEPAENLNGQIGYAWMAAQARGTGR